MDLPLCFDSVSFRRGSRIVLDHLDLTVQPGETLGLVGLNGAGKTTLLRLALGLLDPGAGCVQLFCRDPRQAIARRSVAYLPETHRPLPTLTGRDWLTASLRARGRQASTAALEAAVADLDMDPALLGWAVGRYSKGTAQKLALAGVFLADTPLYVLDEPMSGLDPRARAAFKARLAAARAAGGTVVLSSHILADLDQLCDRIAVLHGGRLVALDRPQVLAAARGAGDFEQAVLALVA